MTEAETLALIALGKHVLTGIFWLVVAYGVWQATKWIMNHPDW